MNLILSIGSQLRMNMGQSLRSRKTEHAVEASWFTAFEEIQVGAISREGEGFNF
jgi:hypothetical protein